MATVSIRHLTFSDLVRYAHDVGPLIATLHLVPTLAAADGHELSPVWPTLALSSSTLRTHFLAYGRHYLVSSGRWWTAFTSMFLHAQADHLANNTIGILFAGVGPHVAFGSVGWWITLLGGNLVAVLSSREGQERQTRGFIERHTGGYIRQDGFLARNLARVQPAAGTCGASAGVFALLGADLCLTLERVLALLADLQRSPEEVVPFDVLQALGLSLPALQRMLSLVEAERRALATGASVSTGHAAHLAGFGWGVCCYLLFREARRRGWAAPWRQLARRARRGGGYPGGRRLGRASTAP
jgi:membrane associated rhomboid family serine protease